MTDHGFVDAGVDPLSAGGASRWSREALDQCAHELHPRGLDEASKERPELEEARG